jgi:hypothetical protein
MRLQLQLTRVQFEGRHIQLTRLRVQRTHFRGFNSPLAFVYPMH